MEGQAMAKSLLRPAFVALLSLLVVLPASVSAQSTTGSLQGVVRDEQGGVVSGAQVTVRNVDTNATRSAVTDTQGRWRSPNLTVGNYEVKVELPGFATLVRSGITLLLNQDAVVDVVMKAATLTETITVQADAPLLNTTNAEVGVRFDTKRIAELPVNAPAGGGGFRDVYSLALSAAGVSALSSGNSTFAAGTNFSVNGMRPRGNNFMIDGQDSNDPSVTGRQQPINNTDIVQEIRLITNQFSAEYGRAAGSVLNIVTKRGTNSFHGSGFWFANRDELNSRSNLDKNAGRDKAPFRKQDQFGGTLGGPVVKDQLFFFGSYQRWTDRQLGSGNTLNGAPTEAGRTILQQAAGSRPQVQALLKFLPAGTGFVKNATIRVGGQTYVIPLGSITGSANSTLDNNQYSGRLDWQPTQNQTLSARYLYNQQEQGGTGQVTPPGLTTVSPQKQHAAALWLTSTLSSHAFNEVRAAFQRLDTATTSSDPSSQEIPSLEISELGLTGFNAASSRTAIGLAVNLPQSRKNNTYQFQDNFTYISGNHSWKFGADVRRIKVDSDFNPTIRGRLAYSTLQSYVDDVASTATINRPLPGGVIIQNYDWWDAYFYAQDEWRLAPSFTLNLGVRYELPGNAVASLLKVNDAIVAAAGGDERYRLSPVPKKDTDNIQPRVGFNWSPHTSRGGLVGFLTGGDRLVFRGGYARTNDYQFLNLALNVASSFPFVASITLPSVSVPTGGVGVPNAFTRLPPAQAAGLDPLQLTRTVVASDFRAPLADQYSVELQRQLTNNLVLRAGYIGTRGKDLFQTLDGNPRQPFSTTRVDPSRGVIRLRANTAESQYDSLQVGLEQRVARGFSAGIYYTYSRFIDTASDTFNPSVNGEVAVAQDSFNLPGDRGRSTYDRPQRVTGSFVWELPFQRNLQSALGRILGGWQITANFNFQDGPPFTPLNGVDPTGALSGIDALVGNSIRPNLNTNLNLGNMTIDDIKAAGGASLFKPICGNPSATCPGERVGNAGRNILRADGIYNIDFAVIKNTRIGRSHNLQLRCEMFNATNSRNFGIPESRINSANFLNEKGTDGGNRFIWLSARYTF
jgi:outer membrane receptor protein involved in Fe transport